MPFNTQRLGPGAIYSRSLDQLFRTNEDLIKVAEIEPQVLWTKGTSADSRPRSSAFERGAIAALSQRLLTHGVGYPLGGTICDHEAHIAEFRLWNEELATPWTSEHLSILCVQGASGLQSCGFLMPPLQTDAGVKLAARNIIQRVAALGLPLAFETGVNYFTRHDSEMPDGDFFAAVAEEAGCGILLDLTNLWINEKNGRAKVIDIVAKLPLERVWEVHFAGSEMEGGLWVDGHSGAIDPALVAIAAEIIPSLPNAGALIFELAPERIFTFTATAYLDQMETLNRLWEKVPSPAAIPQSKAVLEVSSRAAKGTQNIDRTPESWERAIARRMLPPSDRPSDSVVSTGITAEDEERFGLYTHLAASFRTGAIADLLANTLRLLSLAIGREELGKLMDRYLAVTPPLPFPTDEALQFRRFMDTNPLSLPGLDEILKFEGALVEAAANNSTVYETFTKDIDAMLEGLAAGVLPGRSSDRPPFVLEIVVDPVPLIRVAGQN